jgi:hypothetical protein
VWPEKVLNSFRSALAHPGSDTNEAYFHGCWNKLLYTLFTANTDYVVTPQLGSARAQASAFIVHLHGKPVMLLELRAPCQLRSASGRADADEGMRERFRSLMEELEIPMLNAISAFGTHLAFYTFDSGSRRVWPARIPRDNNVINDVGLRCTRARRVREARGYG